MLYLKINIPILYMTCCVKPNITKLNEDYYVCINCLFFAQITDKKSDDCCINLILIQKEFVLIAELFIKYLQIN